MSFKENANIALANQEYSKAINFYTLAIKSEPTNSVLYSSRAKAYYFHAREHPKPTAQQLKKIGDDCQRALSLDKKNYDAIYYNGLYVLYSSRDYDKALRLIEEAYKKSLENAKNSKKYSLPQEIYHQILLIKKRRREEDEEDRVANSNPLFSKLVSLLQQEYHKELDDLNSKRLSKEALEYAVTKLSIKYSDDTKDLIKVFKNSYNHATKKCTSEEPPDYLCDPISFTLLYDPVVTASGHTYERSWLLNYLSSHDTDPLTREKLSIHQCYPNSALKLCVDEYLDNHAKDLDI